MPAAAIANAAAPTANHFNRTIHFFRYPFDPFVPDELLTMFITPFVGFHTSVLPSMQRYSRVSLWTFPFDTISNSRICPTTYGGDAGDVILISVIAPKPRGGKTDHPDKSCNSAHRSLLPQRRLNGHLLQGAEHP
jgi:hypothetical protein